MLILTEKPNVARDFASTLNCDKKDGYFINAQNVIITYCYGHLFTLQEPSFYNPEFKFWTNLPVIPEEFAYTYASSEPKLVSHAKKVIKLLKEHSHDKIIIATDADREGEIIARECLNAAGIYDYSNIKRFWVSEALTKPVILNGLKIAKPLDDYNLLADQGFARQRSDWLVGINFSRYISTAYNNKLPVGRVQTAILNAIYNRCNSIENFKPQKYFVYYGNFISNNHKINGIFIDENNNSKFFKGEFNELINLKNQICNLLENTEEQGKSYPPQLYNLNDLQKDSFRYFEYSAEKTLDIIQTLYESYKCVSYPRTPSKVMGTSNVELCKVIYKNLAESYRQFAEFPASANISLENKRCFNNEKLEAHHAIIPLRPVPSSATTEEINVYNLILNRFFQSFLPAEIFKKNTILLNANGYKFKITGKSTIEPGWKAYEFQSKLKSFNNDSEEQNEENDDNLSQELSNINWNNVILESVDSKEKWTTPPKYFNEASILSFMENPKNINSEESNKKLIGIGTPATRHSFIPKLKNYGYIEFNKKNIVVTKFGITFLQALSNTTINSISDISQTTDWEEHLDKDPESFLENMKKFISSAVSEKLNNTFQFEAENKLLCPLCKKEIKKSAKAYFCTGYNNGCKFPSIWIEAFGTKFTDSDVKKLIAGTTTALKHCTNKAGKKYDCKFKFENLKLTPVFEK